MQSTPVASNEPNRSPATLAARQIRQSSTASRPSATRLPRKPSSSPTTVKMKSVSCAGTNPLRVWVPCP